MSKTFFDAMMDEPQVDNHIVALVSTSTGFIVATRSNLFALVQKREGDEFELSPIMLERVDG